MYSTILVPVKSVSPTRCFKISLSSPRSVGTSTVTGAASSWYPVQETPNSSAKPHEPGLEEGLGRGSLAQGEAENHKVQEMEGIIKEKTSDLHTGGRIKICAQEL